VLAEEREPLIEGQMTESRAQLDVAFGSPEL